MSSYDDAPAIAAMEKSGRDATSQLTEQLKKQSIRREVPGAGSSPFPVSGVGTATPFLPCIGRPTPSFVKQSSAQVRTQTPWWVDRMPTARSPSVQHDKGLISPQLSEAFYSLSSSLAGSPMGRFHNWLIAQRETASAEPGISRRVDGSESDHPSRKLLLPMHLPARPAGLSAEYVSAIRSRARRRRAKVRMLAWDCTEWVVSCFSFLECHCPKSPKEYTAKMGRYEVSAEQDRAVHSLFEELVRFIHLSPSTLLGSGRGMKSFKDMLAFIEQSWQSGEFPSDKQLSSLAQVAMQVKVDRVAVPQNAGQIKPEDILKGDKRESFLNRDNLPPDEVPELPRPCFMVDPLDEPELRRKLIECGMAVLIDEDDISRRTDGRLLFGRFVCCCS